MKYEYLVYVTSQLGIAGALDKYSAQGWRLHTLYGPNDQGGTEGVFVAGVSGQKDVYGDDPTI
ncbi:MAG: hypothetical protein ACPGQC_12060 [Limisphaerales bacterium]